MGYWVELGRHRCDGAKARDWVQRDRRLNNGKGRRPKNNALSSHLDLGYDY
ncbi:MAG: hypothetical protein HQK96_00305 [Nitrospirae bacterium]|nr:hypothetical protein [Nitrospirota bacterium]